MQVLRRMRAIIAAIVAVSVAIFPTAMPQAAAIAGHHHGTAAASVHDHHSSASAGVMNHEHASVGCDNHRVGIANHGACHEHAGTDGSDDAFCCGTIACHAFQLTASPTIYVPLAVSAGLRVLGEEQVTGDFFDRIDRPPRTV